MSQYFAHIENGEIKRINLTLPTTIGSTYIPVSATHENLVPITGDEPNYNSKAQRLAGPTYVLREGYVERVYVVEDIAIDSLKADKLTAVQAEKVRARDAGFMVADTLFDSDISARTSYTELGLRLSQNPSFETQWKASSGQWVLMDAALYSQVVIAGEAHITAVFAWQAAKEQEIADCETVEELEAVDVVYS
jgi:hypothetical protein